MKTNYFKYLIHHMKFFCCLALVCLCVSCGSITEFGGFGTEVGNPAELPEAKCIGSEPLLPLEESSPEDPVEEFANKILDPMCAKLIECNYIPDFETCYQSTFNGTQTFFLAELGVDLEYYLNWAQVWDALDAQALIPNIEDVGACETAIANSSCDDLTQDSQDLGEELVFISESWPNLSCAQILTDSLDLPNSDVEQPSLPQDPDPSPKEPDSEDPSHETRPTDPQQGGDSGPPSSEGIGSHPCL